VNPCRVVEEVAVYSPDEAVGGHLRLDRSHELGFESHLFKHQSIT
jgi:hypothetical protein